MPASLLRLCICLLALAACETAPHRSAEWRGVDLSYVNEIEDCGAVFRVDGRPADPYEALADAGANLVRLRLWHTPDWTGYSTLADVKKSIRRSKRAGMQVLLDFHYSDDWAHPGKQLRPAAWCDLDSIEELASALATYTRETLIELRDDNLFPDFVATGNEINTDLLIDVEVAEDAPIDWRRNVVLLNAAIGAVREVAGPSGEPPRVMLHIAQPENVIPWFDAGLAAGLADFDLIGVSYYPKWSTTPLSGVADAVRQLRRGYGKDVVIVETAYPWTLDGADAAGNLLGRDSLVDGYPATESGQAAFLARLRQEVLAAGGLGIVYWEPAWVSSTCRTRWGAGSHWENATLFGFDGNLLEGARFLAPSR